MRPASILSPLPYYGIGAVERLGTRFGKKKKKKSQIILLPKINNSTGLAKYFLPF